MTDALQKRAALEELPVIHMLNFENNNDLVTVPEKTHILFIHVSGK